MSLEHLDEFEAEVNACREAGENMLASVRVRALRAALAEIRRLRAGQVTASSDGVRQFAAAIREQIPNMQNHVQCIWQVVADKADEFAEQNEVGRG